MKDQYFGDINDYRKYGLLRTLSDAGLRLGVCWMLTHPDDSTDGKHTQYWHEPALWRHFDPQLYDALIQCAGNKALRCVANAARWNLLPTNTVYFAQALPDSREGRAAFFSDANVALSEAELLFFDPDNGIAGKSRVRGRKDSNKYLWWSEVSSAFKTGRSVLVYQHWQRTQREAQVDASVTAIREQIGAPLICTFCTPFVLFLLATQQCHVVATERALAAVAARWKNQIVPKKWRAT
jgi:hypothetical protein